MTNNIYSPVSLAVSSVPFIPPALLPPASPPTATPTPPSTSSAPSAPSARRHSSATAPPPLPLRRLPPTPRHHPPAAPPHAARAGKQPRSPPLREMYRHRARGLCDAVLTAGCASLVDGAPYASLARDIWLGLRRSSIWDGEHGPTWDSPPDDSNGAPQAMGGAGPYDDMPPLAPIDAFDLSLLDRRYNNFGARMLDCAPWSASRRSLRVSPGSWWTLGAASARWKLAPLPVASGGRGHCGDYCACEGGATADRRRGRHAAWARPEVAAACGEGRCDAFRLVGLVDGKGLRSHFQEAEAEEVDALAPAARDAGGDTPAFVYAG
ncbi:hypothetical protein C8R44DRAFT_877534 [Mycena epipterygia]|nr:hypothetical protein C8R44DRAFT_877534 [Mycena epipterygia]